MKKTVADAGRLVAAALLTASLAIAGAPAASAGPPSAATVTLSGRITDSDGAGVARAAVTLFLPGAPAQTVVARTRAGADGRYRLTAVAPGTYFVRATDPSLANAASWWPHSNTSWGAGSITVSTLSRAADLVMIRGLSISGVTRFRGVPQAGVKVCVLADDIPCGFTGRSGRYTIRGIAPDFYRLTAEPTRARSPYALTWWPEYSDAFSVISPVESIESATAGDSWDFSLVRRPRLTGKVVDHFGSAVRNAKVCVYGSTTCARTKIGGTFILKAEVPFHGSLSLVASKAGYTGGVAETFENSGVVVVLERLARITSSKPSISGRVAVGETLVAEPGSWGPDGVTLSYRWYRDRHRISKATNANYQLTALDSGKHIMVKVTGRLPGADWVTTKSRATGEVAGSQVGG